jgi:putative transposase
VPTTDSKHDSPIFPNLYRNVIPTRPNVVWIANFTYIRIASGFCCLAAILDACSCKLVGYAISRNIDTTLALAALRSAVKDRYSLRLAASLTRTGDRNMQVKPTAGPCRKPG